MGASSQFVGCRLCAYSLPPTQLIKVEIAALGHVPFRVVASIISSSLIPRTTETFGGMALMVTHHGPAAAGNGRDRAAPEESGGGPIIQTAAKLAVPARRARRRR